MVTGANPKKNLRKKAVHKATEITSDPFASSVEAEVPKNKKVKKVPTAPAVLEKVNKSTTKILTVKPKPTSADPFAELAKTTSPVRKKAAVPPKIRAKTSKKTSENVNLDATVEFTVGEPEVEVSAVFKALAEVKLPELKRENRARLQMQTPTRLYFYWSVKENPWARLKNVFGDDLGSYTLVVKLIDTRNGREEVKPCEAEGNWWFDVEPDHSYQAEIGFYAPNRPYFRVLYSNEITTPRRTPSPRSATEADWKVTAHKFAEVLDVAGFSRDAFDVVMAGDDYPTAEKISHQAFSSITGTPEAELYDVSAEDIRHALLALASGVSLEDLRFRVSPLIFAILQSNADKMNAGNAIKTLTEYFDIDESEFTEEQFGAAVYGSSLVNFPRTLKTRSLTSKDMRRYNPVSSHSLR